MNPTSVQDSSNTVLNEAGSALPIDVNPRSIGVAPRVLFVIPGEPGGTSFIFAKNQVKALKLSRVIGRSYYLSSRISPMTLLRETKRFRGEIKRFKPDLIHAQYGTMNAFFCAIVTTVPLVITYRGSDLNPCPSIFWLRSVLGRLLSQLAALRARQIICVSEQLKNRLWWGKGRISVLPTGARTDLFFPCPWQEARAALGWNMEERVVLFNAGRYPKVKRMDLAQAAFDVARGLCGNLRLVVLDGFVDHKTIPMMMNAADCLLVTSDWEGSPNIVQEAMACRLPIVTVEVGDVCERLRGVQPSRIVKRDPLEIGRALAELLLKRERSNGYEAVTELAWDKIAAQVLRVYQATIEAV